MSQLQLGGSAADKHPDLPMCVFVCRRAQQVDELLRQFPGCRAVNADRWVGGRDSSCAHNNAQQHCGAALLSAALKVCSATVPLHEWQLNHTLCRNPTATAHASPTTRSVLDLLVELGDNKANTLRITLPQHFPQVRKCKQC